MPSADVDAQLQEQEQAGKRARVMARLTRDTWKTRKLLQACEACEQAIQRARPKLANQGRGKNSNIYNYDGALS